MDQRIKNYQKKHNLTDIEIYDYIQFLNNNCDANIQYCVICDRYTDDPNHSLTTAHALRMKLILKR